MIKFLPGILYVFSMALGVVLLDTIVSKIDPIVSLIITSFFAIIVFHLFTKTKIKTIYQSCWQDKKQWFLINCTVLGTWVSTYYSIKWLNPTGYLFLFFLTLTCTYWIREFIIKRTINRNIINIIFPISFIIIYYLCGPHDLTTQLGIVAGIISGIFGIFYQIISKDFAVKSKLTATDVLAVRFYFVVLLTPFFMNSSYIEAISLIEILKLILVSLFTFILPLSMSQKSLMSLTMDKHVMLISSLPLVAYFLQGIFLQQWSYLLLIMSALTFFFLVASQTISE